VDRRRHSEAVHISFRSWRSFSSAGGGIFIDGVPGHVVIHPNTAVRQNHEDDVYVAASVTS